MGKDISKGNPPILLSILKVLFATMRKKGKDGGKEEERNRDRETEEERGKCRDGEIGPEGKGKEERKSARLPVLGVESSGKLSPSS